MCPCLLWHRLMDRVSVGLCLGSILIYWSVSVFMPGSCCFDFCNTVWYQVVWHLWLCSSFSRLLGLFVFFLWLHTHFWIICLVGEIQIGISWELCGVCRLLWQYGHFNDVDSFYRWAQPMLPFICLHFLSPVSYSVSSTDLLPPWLNLFLGIFLDAILK